MVSKDMSLLQFVTLALPTIAIFLQAIVHYYGEHRDDNEEPIIELLALEGVFAALLLGGLLFLLKIMVNVDSPITEAGLFLIAFSFILLAVCTVPIVTSISDETLNNSMQGFPLYLIGQIDKRLFSVGVLAIIGILLVVETIHRIIILVFLVLMIIITLVTFYYKKKLREVKSLKWDAEVIQLSERTRAMLAELEGKMNVGILPKDDLEDADVEEEIYMDRPPNFDPIDDSLPEIINEWKRVYENKPEDRGKDEELKKIIEHSTELNGKRHDIIRMTLDRDTGSGRGKLENKVKKAYKLTQELFTLVREVKPEEERLE